MDSSDKKFWAFVLFFFTSFFGSAALVNIWNSNLRHKEKMAAIAVADKAVEKGLSLRFDGDIFKGIGRISGQDRD